MSDQNHWYQDLFYKNPQPMFVYDIESLRFLAVNPAAVKMYGYSVEEFLSKDLKALRPTEDIELLNSMIDQLSAAETHSAEVRHADRNNNILHVQITTYPIVHNGRPARAVQVLNISERKKFEEEASLRIQETETSLRAIFESAVDGFLITDIDLNIKAFNARAKDLIFINTTRTELEVGRNLVDYLEPDRTQFFRNILNQVKNGQSVEYQRNHETVNGPCWIHYTIFPVKESEQVTGISIIGRDKTDKVKAEDQLRRSEQLYKTLVKEGSDLINVIDFDGNYLNVSQSINSVLSSKTEEFIGKNAFELVHPEDRERLRQEFSVLRFEKRAKSSPYRFNVGGDNYRWFETVATNLIDDPAIAGIVINSHDVTETINYVHAIKKQNAVLQEIVWIQSHKVRAPLSAILGLTELLLENNHHTAEEAEILQMLKKSAVRLDLIIKLIIKKAEELSKDGDQY